MRHIKDIHFKMTERIMIIGKRAAPLILKIEEYGYEELAWK